MKYLLIILLLLSSNCFGDTKFIISGYSWHVMKSDDEAPTDRRDYNPYNYGVSVNEYVFTNKSTYWAAGVYKNSFGDMSTFIGGGLDFSAQSGVKLGAVTGYPNSMGPVLPMLAPYIVLLRVDDYELLMLMPFMPGYVQAIAVQLRVSL